MLKTGKLFRNILMTIPHPLLFPKHDGWVFIAPHRDTYNGVKTGAVRFHLLLKTLENDSHNPSQQARLSAVLNQHGAQTVWSLFI